MEGRKKGRYSEKEGRWNVRKVRNEERKKKTLDKFTIYPPHLFPQDFWRLVWDYNVKTVVLLGAFEASNEFPMFWPDSEEETIKCDQFKVAFREREDVTFSQNGPSIGVGMDFILQVSWSCTFRCCYCSCSCSDKS